MDGSDGTKRRNEKRTTTRVHGSADSPQTQQPTNLQYYTTIILLNMLVRELNNNRSGWGIGRSDDRTKRTNKKNEADDEAHG